MAPAIAPLLFDLAAATGDGDVQADLLALAEDPTFDPGSRARLAETLAGNRALAEPVRDRLAATRRVSVLAVLLAGGTVSADQARRWLGEAPRLRAARAAVAGVEDPDGRLADFLLDRVDNVLLDLDVVAQPRLPREVRLRAAVRVVGRPQMMITYLRRVVAELGGDDHTRQVLREAGTHPQLHALLDALPATVDTLPRRYTVAQLRGWLAAGPRPDAEVCAVLAADTRRAARIALLTTHEDRAGALAACLDADGEHRFEVLLAALAAPGVPDELRQRVALRLPNPAPDPRHQAPLGPRRSRELGRLMRGLAHRDPDFAGRFFVSHLPSEHVWHASAWACLPAAALEEAAELLLDPDRGLDPDRVDPHGRLRLRLVLDPQVGDRVRGPLIDSLRRLYVASQPGDPQHSVRRAAHRLLDTAAAPAPQRPALLRVEDVRAAAAWRDTPLPGLASLVAETMQLSGLPAGPDALATLSLCADSYDGPFGTLCDAVAAALAVGNP